MSSWRWAALALVVSVPCCLLAVGCSRPTPEPLHALPSAPAPTLVARVEATPEPTLLPFEPTLAQAKASTVAPQGSAPQVSAMPVAAVAPALEPGARIVIPSLDLEAPIQEMSWHIETMEGQPVAVWDTPAGAIGHLKGSALPGSAGHCVLAGHSRPDEGGLFYGLEDLAEGDLIVLEDEAGVQYRYTVRSQETLPELGEAVGTRLATARSVTARGQAAQLSLITCWPDWAYTHRLVVIATLVD